MDRLRPRLAREVWLGFYGGEPLLSWPLVKKTVAFAEKNFKKKFRFTLTTNGSLLKKEHIQFFKKHRFDLVLSYDGLAQKNRDARSLPAVEAALAKPAATSIPKAISSIAFSPRGPCRCWPRAWRKCCSQGHSRLQYALDLCVPWAKNGPGGPGKAAGPFGGMAKKHRQKTGKMPLENFAADGKKGIFACFAGRDRLALLPDRTVWGCYLFYDLLGHEPSHPDYAKYCFGKLEEFIIRAGQGARRQGRQLRRAAPGLFFQRKERVVQPVRRPGELRRLPGGGRPGHRHAGRDPRLDLPHQEDHAGGGARPACPVEFALTTV